MPEHDQASARPSLRRFLAWALFGPPPSPPPVPVVAPHPVPTLGEEFHIEAITGIQGTGSIELIVPRQGYLQGIHLSDLSRAAGIRITDVSLAGIPLPEAQGSRAGLSFGEAQQALADTSWPKRLLFGGQTVALSYTNTQDRAAVFRVRAILREPGLTMV